MVEDSKMGVLLAHRGLDEAKLQVKPPAIVHLDSDWNEITKLSGDSAGLRLQPPTIVLMYCIRPDPL